MTNTKVQRRRFVKACAAAVGAVTAHPGLLADPTGPARLYRRAMLVDGADRALTSNALEPGTAYVFRYPYVTTPCFLLNLGRAVERGVTLKTESGASYDWPGGVGESRSIVAFAAICAHKMSHPAREVSFINYRREKVRFKDRDEREVEREGVIYCCSEKSVYDPASGAQVLGGPAQQPLTTILLQADPTDGTLFAVGTTGGEMYDRFFETFGFRLALESGTSDVRRLAAGKTRVTTIDAYSATRINC